MTTWKFLDYDTTDIEIEVNDLMYAFLQFYFVLKLLLLVVAAVLYVSPVSRLVDRRSLVTTACVGWSGEGWAGWVDGSGRSASPTGNWNSNRSTYLLLDMSCTGP